jgi:fatty acid desaturase
MPTLRYKADVRTLAYVGCTWAVFLYCWFAGFSWPFYLLLLFFSMTMSVIAHNVNHTPMFEEKWANRVFGWQLSLLYGHPTFAWIPTHNENHHVFADRAGDEAITWRLTKKNTWWMSIIYYPVCVYHQTQLINPWLKRKWQTRRGEFWEAAAQYVVYYGYMVVLLFIDWKKALIFGLLPQQFSLWTVHFFNYVQHVGCDVDSEWNHSRNMVGPWLNGFLFNNGFHTVHHWKPNNHWSLNGAVHAEVAHLIHPQLNNKNTLWYLFRDYVIGAFIGAVEIDFTGHVGSEKRVKPPPVPEAWTGNLHKPPLLAA